MALPNQNDIVKMDYPSRGLPYVNIPVSSTVNPETMDYPSRGLPFVTNVYGSSGPVNLKSKNSLAKASIKSMNGLAIASVKKVNGLS